MYRATILFLAAALTCFALSAGASPAKHSMGKMAGHANMKGKSATVTGEVVDTGCYLGHESHGESHVECAAKCISNGMPMGLLTKEGKLYLLTLNHDNPDPYNQLKDMAGKNVSVTGLVMERNGMKGIDVSSVQLAAATK